MRRDLIAFTFADRVPEEIVRTAVRRAACQLVDHPRVHGLPSPIARAAEAIVVPIGTYPDGSVLRVVDPDAARAVMPPTGHEGFVSPAALQLAMAMNKPEMSLVQHRDAALRRGHEIEAYSSGGQGRPREGRMLAQAMLDKARRTLERQRWVAWYSGR